MRPQLTAVVVAFTGCSLLAPSDEELGGGGATMGGAAGSASTGGQGGGSAETCTAQADASLEGAASVIFRSYLDALFPVGDGREGVCDVATGTVVPISPPSATFGLALSPSASGLDREELDGPGRNSHRGHMSSMSSRHKATLSAGTPFEQAERALGARFPASYRDTFATRAWRDHAIARPPLRSQRVNWASR